MEHKTDHSKEETDRDHRARRERRGDRKESDGDRRPRRSDRIEGRRSRNSTEQNSNSEKTDVPNTQRDRFVAFLSHLPFNTSAHDIVTLFYACKILSVSLHFPIDKMEPLNHMENEHGDLIVTSDQKAAIGTGMVEFADLKSLRDLRYCGARIRDQPIGIKTEVYWAGGPKAEQDGTEEASDTVPSDTHSERRREHRRREPREHRTRDGDESSGRRSRRRDNTAHKQEGQHENKTPANDHSHDDDGHSDDSASDSSYESIEAQEARYRFESQFYHDNDDQDGDFMYHV